MSLTRIITPRVVKSSMQLGSIRALSTSPIMASRPDVEIHTGQQFEETDKRNARFAVTGLEKQVNSKWAIDLIAAQPVIKVKTRIVACDGGAGGSLGHPKVYINLDGKGPVSCPYCGLRYELHHHDDEEE